MGMKSLPFVSDDKKNMKHVIEEMMNISTANIIEVEEGTHEQLEKVQGNLRVQCQARTRELIDPRMGILADEYGKYVDKGLDWNRIKDQVMKPGASEDYIIVSFC